MHNQIEVKLPEDTKELIQMFESLADQLDNKSKIYTRVGGRGAFDFNAKRERLRNAHKRLAKSMRDFTNELKDVFNMKEGWGGFT